MPKGVYNHFKLRGSVFSYEHKKRISEARKKQIPPMLGKKHSEGAKKNISAALKNSVALHITLNSPEYKKKIFEHTLNNPNFRMKGKYHSFETRKKMSELNIGKHLSKETKQKLSNYYTNLWKTEEYCRKQEVIRSSIAYRQKLSVAQIGKKLSESTKLKLSIVRLKQVIPVKDTIPELKIQNALKNANISFEKHKAIHGQPDIFIEPNICVFVDGCYWHYCSDCFKNKFLKNSPLNERIKGAPTKDKNITQRLLVEGYQVMRFWEHEINSNIDGCIQQIQQKIIVSN